MSESVNFFPVRPSPNPWIFGGRKWRFWNVCAKIFFTSFLKFIPPKLRQNGTDAIFTYPQIYNNNNIAVLVVCERYWFTPFAAVWCMDTKPHVCKHMFIILSSRIRNRVRIRGFFKKSVWIRPLTRFWDP